MAKWYEFSYEVKEILLDAENPLNLQIGDKILNGFFKLENIETGNRINNVVYNLSIDQFLYITYGTYGTITEFYDLSQISSNGKCMNILQNNGRGGSDNLIIFIEGNPHFTWRGTNISIKNNSVLNANYLNYLKERNIEYYNSYPNIQMNLCLYQISHIYIEGSSYTMGYYNAYSDYIYNPSDPSDDISLLYITPYTYILFKTNINEISGPPVPIEPPPVETNVFKKNKYGDHSSYTRLLKLKNKNIYNVKNSYQKGYYVKNTTEKNSINDALVRTRAGGYTVPPKITKRTSFF